MIKDYFLVNEEDRTVKIRHAVQDNQGNFAKKRFGSGVKGSSAAEETVIVSFEQLSGYEIYEDGKMIKRGGTGVARVVAEPKKRWFDVIRYGLFGGAAGRSDGFLPATAVCHSVKLRVILSDERRITIDLLPRPVPRKNPQYFRAQNTARKIGSEITSIIEQVREEQREKEADRLLNYVKGRERSTSEIVAEAYEKYRSGELTEDEFQRIKFQTMLNPDGSNEAGTEE